MATYKDVKKIQIGDDIYELGLPDHSHPDNNQTVTADNVTFDANAAIELVEGSNVTLTADNTNNKIIIAATDTVYTHPGYTPADQKLYKVAVDELGHVSSVTEVVKSDITALGIPAQDTVYEHPSSHAASMITGLAKVATTGAYSDLSGKPTLSDLGGVPTTRTINNKALDKDITLTAADVGALPASTAVPAPANNATIRIAAATTGATGTIFGDFTTNQSTDETISIPVASTTNAGLMSAAHKSLLDSMEEMYDEWVEKNRPKLGITSFKMSGTNTYTGTTLSNVSSVTITDGFSFNVTSLNWSLANTQYLDALTLQCPIGQNLTIEKTDTSKSSLSVTRTTAGKIAELTATENVSGKTSTVSSSVSANIMYVYFVTKSTSTVITSPAAGTTGATSGIATSTTLTINNISANNEYVYLFLPKKLFSSAPTMFYFNGLTIPGGMSVVDELDDYTFTASSNVVSEPRDYWICRSDNKLNNSNISIKIGG